MIGSRTAMSPLMLLGMLLVGCGMFEVDENLVVGVIGDGLPPHEALIAPDSVSTGVAFDVTITTIGGGCIRRAAATRATSPSPLVRMFLPFDVSVDSGGACTADLIWIRRLERVRFDQPGEGILRVQGRSSVGIDGLATVEKRIVVR